MRTDLLDKLLKDADVASLAAPPSPPARPAGVDLAAVIRSRSARRNRNRRAGALLIVATTCLAVANTWFHSHSGPSQPTAAINVSRLRAEIAMLDSEARYHQSTARAVERAVSIRQHRPLMEDSAWRVQLEREAAAAILVQEAGHLAKRPGTRDLAREELQRAAALFSDTAGGQKARQTLHEGT